MDDLLHPRLVDAMQKGDRRLKPHALKKKSEDFFQKKTFHLKEFEVEVWSPVGGLGAHFIHQLVHNLLTLAPEHLVETNYN